MKSISLHVWALLLAIFASRCFGEDYWQQYVHYKINASLDCNTHIIHAVESLEYHNQSPDTLTELFFHLYPNAFQKNSLMDREARAASVNLFPTNAHFGWIKVDSIRIRNLSTNQSVGFDGQIDDTLQKLKLHEKLLPGERLLITMVFATKIRQFTPAGGKGGYQGNLYEISQWYPKICVYDKHGWHATPYHWLGEFYGELGTFEVQIDVPDSMIVAATGEVIHGDPGWRTVAIDSTGQPIAAGPKRILTLAKRGGMVSRRVVSFYAENVHDFVWTASPDYLYQAGNWQDVPIHVLFQKNSQQFWLNTGLKYAKYALSWLNDVVGKYPYPQLTLCEGVLPGGMEYPMVAILGTMDLSLVVHEICHHYFYGALVNNEAKEGWLDEGIVTYLSERLVRENIPSITQKITPSIPIRAGFIRKQFGEFELESIKLNSLYYYFYSGFQRPIATPPWELGNMYLYSYNTYVTPAKIFAMLEYLLGKEAFVRMVQRYYDQWKFKHVDQAALQSVCEQTYGQSLDWFFDQWIHQTTKIDYACIDFTCRRLDDENWRTDILIKRLGPGMMPVELAAVTQTGDTLRQRWLGQVKTSALSFVSRSPIRDFLLDPDDAILDQNRLNNRRFRIKPFLYPDFPSMYYLPRDAYSVFCWPQLWYNDLDGLKLGLKLSAGYLNRYYIIRNHWWYNVRSHRVDFDFGYTMPWEWLSNNLWRHLYLIRAEGREQISLSVNYVKPHEFSSAENHNFKFGFTHQRVYDDRYTYREQTVAGQAIRILEWEKGSVNQFFLSYSNSTSLKVFPQYHYEFQTQISNELWRSDFNFYSFSLEQRFILGSIQRNWKVNIRNFCGYAASPNDRIPLQQQFGIAAAGANQRFEHFYLRSPGSLPGWLNYYLPGDGNLRGYFDKLPGNGQPFVSERIASLNLEVIHRNFHYLFPTPIRSIVQGIDFYLFFDGGKIWTDQREAKYLFDAGLGWRFYQMILGKQRTLILEFPLWISNPRIDPAAAGESPGKFRWMVSFE